MSRILEIEHDHKPLYRVVRRGCTDPLDISHSKRRLGDYRWNSGEFGALYCCCSEWVARAVALDRLRLAGLDMTDLQTPARPQLVEISWSGRVVDVSSNEGVAAAGFPASYPEGVRKEQTRRAAAQWRATGAGGVVFRSAALQRRGFSHWSGAHQRWSETAIFLGNGESPPTLIRRRDDSAWLGSAT